MLISADVGPVLANDDSEPFKNHRPLAIESLENPREALQVLNGELNSSVLKEKRAPIKTAFHSKEIFSSEQTFLRKIRDSGENLNEFRVENKETLRIETVTKTWLERPDGTNKEEVTETVDTFFVPGLLEHVVHTINSSGNGQVFLDSEAENYQINSKDVIKSLVKKDGREGVDSKHFELVVFVSDYKSRSIEKLRENKVWKQVYSDLLAWAEETSDYFVFLVNEFATPQNIMNLLAEAQENSKIDKIGFTFVGHGVNSIYGQGILTHRDDDPKKFGIMNGKVFENALKKTGTDRLTKLVHTNIHACFQIDAWEENGKNSVLGFFESQNPQQVLTGYRGLTYLNTRFVLALENLLSAGTYIFPRVERKTPVVITQNNGNATVPLGEALLREVKTIDISLLDEDLPAQYEENFDGDDTLFVHDINYSPAPEGERGSAVYSDTSVYETLGTTPPSYFPVEGAPYSFEGHRKGTWTTLTAVDDDERFYFARGGYDAFSDEFSALSSRWNAPNVATTNGYAIVQPGEYLRESTSFTTNRPLNSKATILFEIETISSSTSAVISLNGQANNGLVPSGFTTDRSFGIYITQGYAYAFARGQFFYPQAVNWVESRPYLLTIEFVGDVGIATLTTSEDNDFMISFEVGGFADMINPWLNVHSLQSSTIKVDFYEIAPSRSKSSLQGSFNLIYEDKSVSSIKISGAGGTADSNMEFVNGMRALVAGSTTNPDWLDSPTTIVDSTSRYLVFWAKIPSTTTQFRLGLKVLQGSTLATYYIEPKDMSSTVSLWDFVLKRDNQWHAYIVDLYETFGISYGSIEQFSVQRNTGTVYVDSIFLTRSIGEARDLISSSKRTSEELDTYLENTGEVGVPDAYLQFENNLADSGPNSFDGTFNSASSWIEDFNDNSISSVWTVQNHANMQFREQNQRMEGYQILGGSGNQLAYLTKSISGSQLIQAEIDASYYFPKIGRIYFAGLDSNGKRIWLLGNSDGWAYEGGSMVMSFYDANGNYMSSASFASGSNGLPAQGSLHMKMQYDPSTYTYTLSTTGSYTKTHSFSFATARETAQIQITFGRHATYYSTSSYWRMDNLVETYGASNPVYSSGKVGNGIHLDGNDEWVKIESPNLNPQEQVTMSAWVKLDTIGTYHPVIIQKGTLNSWGRGISITPDGKPYVFSRDASGTWKSVVSTTSMSTGLWTHLAFVQNGQYIYGYMNGILFASLDMGSHSTMQSFFSLGAFPLDNNYRLDGVIDEVFIFSSALSTEQINNLASGVTLNAKYYLGSGEDSSGWDITLNEINSPTYGSSGLVGSYLEHKSTGQRLSGNPNGKLNNVKTFTASIWMQYLATPANWHDIFYLQGSGQRTFDIFIGSSVLGTNFIDANTGSYRTTSVSLANVPVETDRAWHMYTSVWDGTYLRLYVDGVQVASANFAGSMPGQTPTVLAIGDGQFNANLADARIYRGAMSTAQIQALYRQTKPVQSYSMEPLTTDDNPLYTFSTTIEKGDISGSKVAEFKVQVGSSYYGLKLENNVWKYLGGSSIAQLSGFAEGSYTIQFDIYKTKDSYGVTATNLAVSVTPDGANTTEVIKTTIPTGVVIPHVNVLPGYITTTTISSSAQLGSSLYTIANGLLTEGAFAIKFEQETYVETATVTAIVNTYGNNLLGLAEDYLVFLQCGTVDVNPNTCPDPEFIPGSPYDSNFINTIQNVRGLNLNAAGIKWQDRWFNTVLKDYGNNVISRLEAKQIGTDYYFYYNKPRTSLTVELTVEGINGHDFKLTKVSSSGSILATYSGTTYPYTTTLTVDPTQMHFFYLQIAHDADISNIGINFKPLAPNTYAHYEGLNPNGISTEVRSTYSLLTDPVSYVKYRWDENGNPVEPVFEALPEFNGRYWLHKMVTMGGLPQQGNTPIGTHITADTYASSANPIGEKLVAGTKYWNTQNGAEEFYTKVLSSDGTFQLTHNVAYMTSFAIQSRSKMTVQLDIIVTETSEIDLYLDGTDPLPRPIPVQTGPGSSLRKYSYYVDIGTSLSSFLIKIVARETSYTTQRIIGSSILTYSVTVNPLVEVQITPSSSLTAGVFELVNDVEEFIRYPTASGKLTALVRGQNFNMTTENQKMDAQVPPSARASMQTAAQTNPTENRVFDVTMLLEKITARFISFRDSIKDKVYSTLTFQTTVGWYTYTDKKLADAAWGLLDTYGFGTVEKIITWYEDEQRQTMLANVILNDDTLRNALNYGEPANGGTNELDYRAVAEAGILVFADWVHKTYIQPTALNTLWTAIKGSSYTLTDLVAELFSGLSTVVSTVKAGVSAAWDGIKAGASFILREMFRTMLSTLAFAVNSAMKGFASLITALDPSMAVDLSGSTVRINGLQLGVEFSNDVLTFFLGRTISLIDIFGNPTFETLGVDANIGITILNHIFADLLVLIPETWSLFKLEIFLGLQIGLILTRVLLSDTEVATMGVDSQMRNSLLEFLSLYHFITGFFLLMKVIANLIVLISGNYFGSHFLTFYPDKVMASKAMLSEISIISSLAFIDLILEIFGDSFATNLWSVLFSQISGKEPSFRLGNWFFDPISLGKGVSLIIATLLMDIPLVLTPSSAVIFILLVLVKAFVHLILAAFFASKVRF